MPIARYRFYGVGYTINWISIGLLHYQTHRYKSTYLTHTYTVEAYSLCIRIAKGSKSLRPKDLWIAFLTPTVHAL